MTLDWISKTSIGEVLNAFGNIDVDINKLEDVLSNFNYMTIQFENVPLDFSVNMAFTLFSIFKDNLG